MIYEYHIAVYCMRARLSIGPKGARLRHTGQCDIALVWRRVVQQPNGIGRKTTQRDIARALGVSWITVQRALNDSGYVSAGLKARIIEHARSVGYRPHRAAQTLVRKRLRSIALFSTESPQYFWDDVGTGAELARKQIADFGYEVGYYRVPRANTSAYLATLRSVLRQGVDAIAVVNNIEYDMPAVFRELDGSGAPYITFNIDAESTGRLAYVGPDYVEQGRLGANILVECTRPGERLVMVESMFRGKPCLDGANIPADRIQGFNEYLVDFPDFRPQTLILDAAYTVERKFAEVAAVLKAERAGTAGIYWACADEELFERSLPMLAPRCRVVWLNLAPRVPEWLASGAATAAIFQNPVMQGYYAVKMLEHIVERRQTPTERKVTLAHDVLFRRNVNLLDNFYSLLKLHE
jgi:LacI family transcriptional regulator